VYKFFRIVCTTLFLFKYSMRRIIVAGDSWGTHSYENGFNYQDLDGFKFAPKKKYVLYPGPGHFLSELTDLEVITVADHGFSNQEAFMALEKIKHKDDIIIFYKTGLLREIYKAYLNNTIAYSTNDCEKDYKYYSDLFYKKCNLIECFSFNLIGGCVRIHEAQAGDMNVIEPSITEWLYPDFRDNDFDPTVYWLEYKYSCDYFKKSVIESHKKIEFWNERKTVFHKKHPTVHTNKKIAKRIYNYLKDKDIL
jgi:hypothetical protein